jgi:hypothetical protein
MIYILIAIVIILTLGLWKFSNYAKIQLETGGVKCKCSNPVCSGTKEEHPNGLTIPQHSEYILDPATPKCSKCHIMPATKTNAFKELMCVQCK